MLRKPVLIFALLIASARVPRKFRSSQSRHKSCSIAGKSELKRTQTCAVSNEMIAREQYSWEQKVRWRAFVENVLPERSAVRFVSKSSRPERARMLWRSRYDSGQ